VSGDVGLEARHEPQPGGHQAVHNRRAHDEPAPAEPVGERAEDESQEDARPHHGEPGRKLAVVDRVDVGRVGQRQ
jgi:hypothetical protein